MALFGVDEISNALNRNSAPDRSFPDRNGRVAVAIILAGPADNLSICLIRRASFETDVWSGHMALPGGRARPGETTAVQVAERETREEIGLQIGERQRKGVLPEIVIRLAGRDRGMTLSAVVYLIGEELPLLHCGEEVAEAFWTPVSHLWDSANATTLNLSDKADVMAYPAIRLGQHIVWGVTLRVLMLFSDIIGHPLPHFEEIPGLRVN
jgi:8-oxo-dGTP pyrophosphatase MutT (NUDIX family)